MFVTRVQRRSGTDEVDVDSSCRGFQAYDVRIARAITCTTVIAPKRASNSIGTDATMKSRLTVLGWGQTPLTAPFDKVVEMDI